jgi:hypothetical protein
MKVDSPDVLHKSDVGAVRVGVTPADAPGVYDELLDAARAAAPGAELRGVLVQEQVEPGIELLVGVQGGRDGYRPIVTVGLGGTAVEIYADVASALAPVNDAASEALLRSLRGGPLLDGFRGRPAADVRAAARAIAAISELGARLGDELLDLEVNPLIVHEHGVHAVDFVCRLRRRDG